MRCTPHLGSTTPAQFMPKASSSKAASHPPSRAGHRVRGPFFLVKVTAEGLSRIARLIREPKLERVERIGGGIPWHVGLILDHGL